MGDLIQLRGGTYPILNAENPVLAEREIVLELDTGRFKVGDGTTAWLDLPYKLVDFIFTKADERYARALPRWFERYATVDRPDAGSVATYSPAATYYDTTLNMPAWSDGTDWRDATGTVI